MTLNIALRVALGSGIIFTKFDLRQLIRAWIIAFYADSLCNAVTLIIDPLILKVCGTLSVTWSKSVRNFSEIEQSLAELLIILRICAYVLSRPDHDLRPLDLELLQHFGCHEFKLCTKFERNRIICGWVIDDLARFRQAILGGGAPLTRAFSVVRGPNFTELDCDIGRSSQHCTFVSEFGYLTVFSNAGGSKLNDVENDVKFRNSWPPVKIRGGMARSLYQLLKLRWIDKKMNKVHW